MCLPKHNVFVEVHEGCYETGTGDALLSINISVFTFSDL